MGKLAVIVYKSRDILFKRVFIGKYISASNKHVKTELISTKMLPTKQLL